MGKRLKTGKGLRITQGKIRKVFFDVMTGGVEDRLAIDLFAGVGTMGIEALSRGAREVIFIEKEKRLASIIEENLRDCGLAERGEVWVREAFQSLPILKKRGFFFEFFYIDPPYDFRETIDFLKEFFEIGILDPLARGAVEHSRHLSLPPEEGHFKKWKEKRFGETNLTFYRGVLTG